MSKKPFEYDILLLYPERLEAQQALMDWVYRFSHFLDELLNRLLDYKPTIMLGSDLTTREQMLSVTREDIFRQTGVFVVVVSEELLSDQGYLVNINSIFDILEQRSREQHTRLPKVLLVSLTPLIWGTVLPRAQALLPYEFWHFPENSRTPTLTQPAGDGLSDNVFWRRLVDMAYDLAEALQEYSLIRQVDTVSASAVSVLLLETTPDQYENRQKLKRELQERGIGTLPRFRMSTDVNTLKAQLDEALVHSSVVVQILGSVYGDYLPKSALSLGDFQYKYISESDKGRLLPRLIWIPYGARIPDQRQQNFINRIKREIRNDQTEVIVGTVESLKGSIFRKLNLHKDRENQSRQRCAYLIHNNESQGWISRVINRMKEANFEILTNHQYEPFELARHFRNLQTSDLVAVLDSGNPAWNQMMINDAAKALAYSVKSNTYLAFLAHSDQHSVISGKPGRIDLNAQFDTLNDLFATIHE